MSRDLTAEQSSVEDPLTHPRSVVIKNQEEPPPQKSDANKSEHKKEEEKKKTTVFYGIDCFLGQLMSLDERHDFTVSQ